MPTVLGGGIGGLTAAHYLAKRFISPVSLYEASNRFGGWIRTERHDDKGYIFETGPRTIRPKGLGAATTMELIEDLDMEKEIQPIFSTHPAAKNRLIYVKNKLFVLPSSIFDLFRTIPPFTKPLLSGIFNDIKAPPEKKNLDDESIYDFVERRFGTEIAQYAVSAMICGICAGDAKEISVRFLMNDLFETEQKYGGVIKGILYNKFFGKKNININKKYAKLAENGKLIKKAKKENWSMYSLQGGLETLPKAIVANLSKNGVQLKNKTECKKITFADDHVKVTVNGVEEITDHIISALPSFKLAKILEIQHPSLAGRLRSIPYVDVAVVNLRYSNGNLLNHDAFGFLVPPIERVPILGIIFDSCCFNMGGNTVLTVMMGGRWFNDFFGSDPSQKEILDVAKEQIKNILKINDEPKLARVNILKDCIPQYTIGHKARVEGIRNYIEKYNLPLTVCGASYDGVGINDVILSSKTQVYKLID